MLFQFAGNLDVISALDPREGLLLRDFVPFPQLTAFQTANFFFLLSSNLTPLKHEAARVCMKSFYTCPLMGKKREDGVVVGGGGGVGVPATEVGEEAVG